MRGSGLAPAFHLRRASIRFVAVSRGVMLFTYASLELRLFSYSDDRDDRSHTVP